MGAGAGRSPRASRALLVACCVVASDARGPGAVAHGYPPCTGFFAYTSGCLVVVEDLHSGAQQHWLGHPEEISTLALSHDAQVLAGAPAAHPGWMCSPQPRCPRTGAGSRLHSRTGTLSRPPLPPAPDGPAGPGPPLTAHPPAHQVLASASGCGSTASCCQIRIWNVPGGSCRQLISYHSTAVQALAFSPDDELLVTLGQWVVEGRWPLDGPARPGTRGLLIPCVFARGLR